VEGPYLDISGRSFYDITQRSEDPFPPPWFQGFLNQAWVQRATGVPLNYTVSSNSVYTAFRSTGDYARGGQLQDLASILDSGVKVALVYGDRDYACNWIGGEQVSLAIPHTSAPQFRQAGYADLRVNDTYVGGMTRQYGNLSFTRVFEAGHEVPAYQPEAAYQIFRRALFNRDVATGKQTLTPTKGGGVDYGTMGPSSTWQVKNEVPPMAMPTCYVLNPATCTLEQYVAVLEGRAEVRNWVVMDNSTMGLFDGVVGGTSGGAAGVGSGGGSSSDGGRLVLQWGPIGGSMLSTFALTLL